MIKNIIFYNPVYTYAHNQVDILFYLVREAMVFPSGQRIRPNTV
jgi:hypothetical protein